MASDIIEGLGGRRVYINEKLLSPSESLSIRNHSPDGFAWGYGGSGPAQLALALLLKYEEKSFALIHYQDFKFDIIAKLPSPKFVLHEEEIKNWIKEKKNGK